MKYFNKGGSPPTPRNISTKNIWFHSIYIYKYIITVYLYTYIRVFKYMYVHTLYVYVCVCMHIQNERVCHTISRLKCAIRRTPPRPLLETQKIHGVVYFMWSGGIFLNNFLPYPPPKYSRVKGGVILFRSK